MQKSQNQPTYLGFMLVTFIIGVSLFCMYLAYDQMKQNNQMGSVFYIGLSMGALTIIFGSETQIEIESRKQDSPPQQMTPVVTPPIFRPTYTRTSRKGYVYALAALHDPTVFKIGRTNNPNDRLRTFSVKLPFDVEFLHVIKTDDMYALESQLHRKFAEKRVNGEWFRLDNNDLAYIADLAH